MHREKLIHEVKEECARLAQGHSPGDFTQSCAAGSPQVYFEQLLQAVIGAIELGKFDRFMNGRQVMEAVANNGERFGIPA